MSILFAKAFKSDGEYLLEIAEQCQLIKVSDHLSSDIAMITDTLGLLTTTPNGKLGSERRNHLFDRYRTLFSPVLFDGWVKMSDIDELVNEGNEKLRNTTLIRLTHLKQHCSHNQHNALLISMLVGILSGIPTNIRSTTFHDCCFEHKIKLINATVTHIKSSWKRFLWLKTIVRDLSLQCDSNLVNSMMTFVNVHILINILQHDRLLNSDLSILIYNRSKSFVDELINSLSLP